MDYILPLVTILFWFLFGVLVVMAVINFIVDPINGIPYDKPRKEMIKRRKRK